MFFADSLPTLEEGALLAYWSIKQAITLASPHIGLGIDVFVLDPNATPRTRELSDAEVAPHLEFIDEAANVLARAARSNARQCGEIARDAGYEKG